MTSVTVSGRETMITWEPSASVIVARARLAIERMTSAPAALSPVGTTAQAGNDFQAGAPDGSENANSAAGRCVAAMAAVCSGGRSAANASWNFAGSIANSKAGSAPSPFGYRSGTSAVMRTLSLELPSISARVSPSSGAKAATYTSPTTLSASVAALEITAPPYE